MPHDLDYVIKELKSLENKIILLRHDFENNGYQYDAVIKLAELFFNRAITETQYRRLYAKITGEDDVKMAQEEIQQFD